MTTSTLSSTNHASYRFPRRESHTTCPTSAILIERARYSHCALTHGTGIGHASAGDRCIVDLVVVTLKLRTGFEGLYCEASTTSLLRSPARHCQHTCINFQLPSIKRRSTVTLWYCWCDGKKTGTTHPPAGGVRHTKHEKQGLRAHATWNMGDGTWG